LRAGSASGMSGAFHGRWPLAAIRRWLLKQSAHWRCGSRRALPSFILAQAAQRPDAPKSLKPWHPSYADLLCSLTRSSAARRGSREIPA